MKLAQALQRPVVAALRSAVDVEDAIQHGLGAVVLLRGDIFDVISLGERAKEAGLLSLIHVDLVEGIGRDPAGMRFLARYTGAGGIITTKSRLVREARDAGLIGILRLFLLDSQAYSTGVEQVRSASPDAVEVLPGLVMPHLAEDLRRDIHHPIIAGGLIRTVAEARAALAAGAVAISTSRKELWALERASG